MLTYLIEPKDEWHRVLKNWVITTIKIPFNTIIIGTRKIKMCNLFHNVQELKLSSTSFPGATHTPTNVN